MNTEGNTSSVWVFIVKFVIVLLIFGGFPVFLTLVVKNYNRQAEGMLQKRNSIETVQEEVLDEVKVLTQEDALALQNINQYILGDWKNPSDVDYRIRFETDNSFTEYKGERKVGYGLWRATVRRVEAQGEQDKVAEYYIIRTQFESGKKSDPVIHKILLLDTTKLTVSQTDGTTINFER